jgi:hypothetical protein
MQQRFMRLAARAVGGAKLAGRRAVNPALSHKESFDSRRFGALLAARFGVPDTGGDDEYSYPIQDLETGVRFLAYSAQSGPAYGGSPADCFIDYDRDDYRLKPEVLRALQDFEAWLTATSTGNAGEPA